jgi:hypothetical protein
LLGKALEEVPLQAMGVILETGCLLQWEMGSEIGGYVNEWPVGYAATTRACREKDLRLTRDRDSEVLRLMWDILAISAEGVLGTVEKRVLGVAFVLLSPVPVRQSTSITTEIAQRALIRPDEIPVPGDQPSLLWSQLWCYETSLRGEEY